MDSFLASLNAISSMAIPLLVGILLRVLHILDGRFSPTVSTLIYNVCLPVSLGCSMYASDLHSSAFPLAAIGYTGAVLTAAFVLLCIFVRRAVPDGAKAGSIVQGCFRGNASVYGIPLGMSLFGGIVPPELALIMLASVVFFNILAVLTFVLCSGAKASLRQTLLSIAKNPCICGILLGLLLNVVGLRLPKMLYQPISAIGSITTPLCFIAIGTTFQFTDIRENARYAGFVTLIKLVVLPVIAIGLGVLLGFRGPSLVGLLSTFATPCAVGSYPMALKLGGNGPLSAQALMYSTLASIATMFLFIFVLRGNALI